MNTRIFAVSLLVLLGVIGAATAQDAPVAEAMAEESPAAAAPAQDPASVDASAQSAQPATSVTTENTLLIERVSEENKAGMPARGMTMAQVEAKYGAPSEKLEPQGGQKRQWPTIHRWTYSNFVVYFEKSKVIDAVAVKADATEVGPKPPIR